MTAQQTSNASTYTPWGFSPDGTAGPVSTTPTKPPSMNPEDTAAYAQPNAGTGDPDMFTRPDAPIGDPLRDDLALAVYDENYGMRGMGSTAATLIARTDIDPTTKQALRWHLEHARAAINATGDGIRKALKQAEEGAGYVLPSVRLDKATQTLTDALDRAGKHAARFDGAVEQLAVEAKRALLPVRPASVSEVAEAERKRDLRMRLDGVLARDLAYECGRLLHEAAELGDETTVWLLGRAPWIDWYLTSRGIDAGDRANHLTAAEKVAPRPPAEVYAQRLLDDVLPHLQRFAAGLVNLGAQQRPNIEDRVRTRIAGIVGRTP